MSLEACKYILSSGNIAAGAVNIKREFETREADGRPVPENVQKDILKENVRVHVAEWGVKLPKIAALLNPAYGDFFQKCVELFNWVEREKKGEVGQEGERWRKDLVYGLDRCRMFSGQAGVSNRLRCQLLEAEVKPDLRKDWFHPAKLSENDTKLWIVTWGMWENVEGIAILALEGILDEILPFCPNNRRSVLCGDKILEVRDSI